MDDQEHQKSNNQPDLHGFGLINQEDGDLSKELRLSHQEIIKDKLRIIIFLPGIEKKSLQIRNRADILAVSARYNTEISRIFNQPAPLEIRVNLIVKVDPTSTKASYTDGILKLTLDMI